MNVNIESFACAGFMTTRPTDLEREHTRAKLFIHLFMLIQDEGNAKLQQSLKF